MRVRILLAAILVSLSFCFVSGVGYGEIEEWWNETSASFMDLALVDAKVRYIMAHPDIFLRVGYNYDPIGSRAEDFPAGVRTKGKIVIDIKDNRNVLSDKLEWYLLRRFEIELVYLYSFIDPIATDMNTDVVAKLYSKEGIPLAYFYQGEYHLWKD